MKAVVFYRHGGPEVLEWAQAPEPVLKSTDVLVEVHACSINHLDIWIRKGLPHQEISLPHILGADVSGVIKAVGKEVADICVGDQVIVAPGLSCGRCEECAGGRDNLCARYSILGEHVPGGYAAFVAVPCQNIFPMPQRFSFVEAAAFPLTFLTAWQMVVRKGKIAPHQTVLIWGIGGGVGNAAFQIAKMFGAKVIGVSGSEKKVTLAREMGVDEAISGDEVAQKIKDITRGRGVDLVIEHTGEVTWEQSIRAVRRGGKIVTCGATTGYRALTDLRHVFYRQIEILGSTMGSRGDLYPILAAIEAGKLNPRVDRVLPLAEASKAHQLMEDRKLFGKIVLTI